MHSKANGQTLPPRSQALEAYMGTVNGLVEYAREALAKKEEEISHMGVHKLFVQWKQCIRRYI